MLKKLITDITNGEIKISSALKKCKIILSLYNDEELQTFISSEANGYLISEVPSYRILNGVPSGIYKHKFFGDQRTIPLNFSIINKQTGFNWNERKVNASIIEIESLLENAHNGPGQGEIHLYFSPDQLKLISQNCASDDDGWYLESAWWVFSINSFQLIYSQTENRLIDILVRLNKENTSLNSNLIKMTEIEKNASTHNVHIAGNFTGNFNTGNIDGNFSQEFFLSKQLSAEDEEQLRISGVLENEIAELKNIMNTSKDKPSFVSKSLKWLSTVASSLVARGLYDNVPQITGIIQSITS